MNLSNLTTLLVKAKNLLKQYPFIFPRSIVYSARDWINKANKNLDWFRKKNSDWYLLKENETIAFYLPPNSIYDDITIHFKENLIKKNIKSTLYFLKGAYIFSNYGTVLSRKNEVFDEFCHYFSVKKVRQGKVFYPFKTLKFDLKKIRENSAVLAAPESENYYHWIMDSLPRLCLVEEFINAIDFFIVPSNIQPFHINSLKYWGIDENKLIKMTESDKIYFENLFVPSLPGSEGNSPKWAVNYLRKKFLIEKTSLEKTNLVFFSRKNVQQRRIVNESEVIDVLQKRGFLIYEMSSYSLDEQILISRKAKIIVSPHGASLTNLVFADNCKLLEIFSPDYIRPDCFFTLACMLEIEYWYLIGKDRCLDNRLPWGDIYVDINELNTTLNRMLNARQE